MTIALRFIIANSRVDITLRVTSISGAFRITTSEAQQLVEKREADVRLVLGEPEDVVVGYPTRAITSSANSLSVASRSLNSAPGTCGKMMMRLTSGTPITRLT